LTFVLLIWQGLGAGMAANPWQNLIAKIIPPNMRGTFLGAQSAVANALASISAISAGMILERMEHPTDYIMCFILASIALVISWFFLTQTREEESVIPQIQDVNGSFWGNVRNIVQTHPEFRKFLLIRSLLAFASLAFAFYAVYAVHTHHVSEGTIGIMTGVLMGTQIAANPIMGWLGDRFGHRFVMEGGVFACILSAGIAWWSPHPNWFYGVFILTGIGNVAVWTTGLAMTLEFGTEQDRPAYIGLANTLVAPSTILAPLLGGWIADQAGYPFTFGLSILCGIITLIILFWMRWTERDPRPLPRERASTG
jgi:MFS family permease